MTVSDPIASPQAVVRICAIVLATQIVTGCSPAAQTIGSKQGVPRRKGLGRYSGSIGFSGLYLGKLSLLGSGL